MIAGLDNVSGKSWWSPTVLDDQNTRDQCLRAIGLSEDQLKSHRDHIGAFKTAEVLATGENWIQFRVLPLKVRLKLDHYARVYVDAQRKVISRNLNVYAFSASSEFDAAQRTMHEVCGQDAAQLSLLEVTKPLAVPTPVPKKFEFTYDK